MDRPIESNRANRHALGRLSQHAAARIADLLRHAISSNDDLDEDAEVLRRSSRAALRVVIVRPGEPAEPFDLLPGLETKQRLLGGCVDAVTLEGEVAQRRITAWLNDAGVQLGLPWNRKAGPQIFFAGTILILADDAAGKCVSLTEGEQARVIALVNDTWPKLSPTSRTEDLRPSSIDELETWLDAPVTRFFAAQGDESLDDLLERAANPASTDDSCG